MKKYIGLLTLFLIGMASNLLLAQQPPADYIARENGITYAKTITAEELKKHLTIIASDEFAGRETGTEDLTRAAEYITTQLKGFGVQPLAQLGNSYYQPVPYAVQKWGEVTVTANGETFKIMRDFYSFAALNENMPSIEAKEVLFLGYGIDAPEYSDYKGVDVKDKVLIIYEDEPKDAEGNAFIEIEKKSEKWTWRKKVKVAKAHGAKLLLIITPNTMKVINQYGNQLIEPTVRLYDENKGESEYMNHLFISPTMAKTILGKKYKKLAKVNKKIMKTKTAQHLTIPCKFSAEMPKSDEQVIGNNILGFIEGSDGRMKDEVVVVSAHYDHIGKRGEDVFNGADDNGSGTTALLEMVQAFAQAQKNGEGPRRSVLFLWVAGEEKGLLGSEYYSEHPVFPLENTVADVNVDMIGRTDEKYEKEGNSNYIYVIGSDRLSTELHNINEEANKLHTNLILDYTYNAESDPNRYYYRSDHYNFAKNGIPSIFYFNGVHADYHKETDTVDKIEFEKMQKIATLIFHTAWELANRNDRIKVDVKD